MPRRPALFTQADLARVFRAARAAGVRVRVDLAPDGTMRVTQADNDSPQPPDEPLEQRPPEVLV